MQLSKDRFPFDLGRAFPDLTQFLTTRQKLNLSATCSLLRCVLLQPHTWHQFIITDIDIKTSWTSYLDWLHKYIDIIKPTALSLNIFDEQHEKDKALLRLFMTPRPYIQKIELMCKSNLLHLAVSHSCHQLTSITLHSPYVSDQLVQAISQTCTKIQELNINSDSLEFSGANIASYLTSPLETLILKPYQLDYEALIRLFVNEPLNRISQLQIDVQECDQTLLPRITSNLPYIRKLRMYHFQKFLDGASLAQNFTSNIIQLTLTKCYKLDMNDIINKIASVNLQKLDLTQALLLNDRQLLNLSQKAVNLRHLNISWCNEISNNALQALIQKCLKIQTLILNGIKNLNDTAFKQYNQLKNAFQQKKYDEIRFQFKKIYKNNKNTQEVLDYLEPKASPIFIPIQGKTKTLRNIKYLQCNSCNNISDQILKIIYCANRMAKVINYYGEILSLYHTSQLSDDQY